MEEHKYQKYHLERIFNEVLFAPVFHRNPKYCINQFSDLIPYISYDDVMGYKYIIRGLPILAEPNHYDSEAREIIAEYKNLEELVNAGWRLD